MKMSCALSYEHILWGLFPIEGSTVDDYILLLGCGSPPPTPLFYEYGQTQTQVGTVQRLSVKKSFGPQKSQARPRAGNSLSPVFTPILLLQLRFIPI